MDKALRIGTRDSQLAVWQATLVKDELAAHGITAELVLIKSDGDIDLITPIYAMNVQGVFTKTLDAALLSKRIDIAVHSMKDVPTQLAQGTVEAAVLKRASHKDILVFKDKRIIDEWKVGEAKGENLQALHLAGTVATSSIRRKAQWLNRYPNHQIENLRGNVNTRLRKLAESSWDGAIFAAAGLERINIRPENSIELNWMQPAPAQGAIMVVCRQEDSIQGEIYSALNDETTALCARIERDFLKTLLAGCSTPVSALAEIENNLLRFSGSIFSLDGKDKVVIEKTATLSQAGDDKINYGIDYADEVLENGGAYIAQKIRDAAK